MHRLKVVPIKMILGCLAFLWAAGTASAAVIDFSLPAGTLITNQYPEATFSSEPGQGLYAYFDFACTGNPTVNCTQDVYIDFAAPASNISILALQPNQFGTVATFYLYNGATLLGTQDLIGLSPNPGGFATGNILVDLGAFSNVTRLEIRGPGGSGDLDNSYSGNGIGWDNLTFDPGSTAVPEPQSLVLLAIGMLAAAWVRSR